MPILIAIAIVVIVLSNNIQKRRVSLGYEFTFPKEVYDTKKLQKFYKMKDYFKAIEYIDKQIEKYPKNNLLHNERGYILAIIGKHEEALNCFSIAINLNPYYNVSLCNKIWV